MKKHYFLLIIAAFLLACNTNEPDIIIPPSGGGTSGGSGTSGGGSSQGGGGTATTPTADFAYTPVPPFAFEFSNMSTGASSYKWDFGDGSTSNAKNPTHRYAKAGTYTVTLTATSSSNAKATKSKSIMVNEPTVYIIGYRLSSIPYENKYYRIRVCDDYIFSPDWYFYTQYTPLLDFTDIPYTCRFQTTVVEMNRLNQDSYYNIYLYHNTSTSNTNGDVQCLHKKLNVSEIKSSYASEYTFVSDNGQAVVTLLMGYE